MGGSYAIPLISLADDFYSMEDKELRQCSGGAKGRLDQWEATCGEYCRGGKGVQGNLDQNPCTVQRHLFVFAQISYVSSEVLTGELSIFCSNIEGKFHHKGCTQ